MKRLMVLMLFVLGCGDDAAFSTSGAYVGGSTGTDDAAVSSGGEVSSSGSGGGSGSGGDTSVDAGLDVEVGGSPSSAGSGGEPAGGAPDSGGIDGGAGGDPGSCSVGATQCVDVQRQTCIGGIWLDNGAPCPGWCIDGACVDCRPGSHSCASDTQPQVCGESGSWAFDAACSGDKPWCSEGACMGYCCSAGAFDVACDPTNPWSCGDEDCTSGCTSGVCQVPGSFTGTVEVCP